MRSAWRAAAIALLVASAACNRIELHPLGWGRPTPQGPNVLLVTIDTLRADHVGAYGARDAATPTLDALAAEGARFETAIASSPLTLPSHASILTGRYPPAHGVRHNGTFRLEAEVETLAERMTEAGYSTGAFVSAWVLSRPFGLAQGFDRFDDRMSARRAVAGGYLERKAADTTGQAIAWLAQCERPFFLWVHYYDPHADYSPPAPLDERFRARPYDGEIAHVDAELARLLGALRDSGRLERTLVVATADHGESLGEHLEETHSYTLYDATLAVPLLVRGPGVPAGRVVGGVVRSVDVAPTILARAGIAAPAGLDGEDLSPLWSDGPPSTREAYAETLATELDHGWSPIFAVRTSTHHYVRAPRPELYDVRSDPRQVHDLAARDPVGGPTIVRLDAEIERVLGETRGADAAEVDADTRARLAALGYATSGVPVTRSGLDPKDGLRSLGGYLLALQAAHEDQLEVARRLLERTLAEIPTSPSAHFLLGQVQVLAGRAPLALEHAEAAARLAPTAPNLVLLGDVRVHLGDVSGATAAYREAARISPDDPSVRVGLTWVALQEGDRVEADDHARRAIELHPSSAEIRNAIASVWERAGEYERALESYREALRLDPEAERTHMALAIQLARLGREAEVEQELVRAGKTAQIPHLRNRLAIVYAARGEHARAETIFRDLVQRHPEYPTPRANLATLLAQAGRTAPGDGAGAARPGGPGADSPP